MFEQSFKNIDNLLRKDKGLSTEIDYVEQTNDWLRRIEDVSTVEGMFFDGKEYFPVY